MKDKGNNMFGDIDRQSVDKAKEILPKIILPQPGEPAIVIRANEEPYVVQDNDGRDMFVGDAEQLVPNKMLGTMIYPKSLRFNIAKALSRRGVDYAKAKIKGMAFKVWSVEDKGQKFYQAEVWETDDQ